MINLDQMYNELINGKDIVDSNVLNTFALEVLSNQYDLSDKKILHNIDLFIKICNILYNNTDREDLPIEDGIYDMVMVLASKYIPNYSIGAMPTNIKITKSKSNPIGFYYEDDDILKQPFIKLDEDKINNGLYTDDLINNPNCHPEIFYPRGMISMDVCKKKIVNIPHEYPKLVGTLDKAKFVLNSQADEKGVLYDDNVSIFERDFLLKHLKMGLFSSHDKIRLLATLKMDGVSVEATVSDHIISARSRGDTNNDIASDLTPALRGYRFPKAYGYVNDYQSFGMKFECMLSNHALQQLSVLRGVEYANPRNAIIGLLGAGDCNQWLEYITLIPLETSLDIDPLDEILFMNELYAKEPLRYAVIEGTYEQVLFQVKKFVEEAEYLRPIMPYIYDGVVLTYIDKDIREKLGRENSVNKYSIAIKFNPIKKYTKFIGYTYSIGQNGTVTPIAHYQPIELFGAIHSKTTAHSLSRFNELSLREGDVVSIELINDVIPYISKADVYENECNMNPIIEFPRYCPSCGTELIISDSGKTVVCPNIQCPERRLSITSNMLSKLGFKDFSEESLRNIKSITSLTSLIHVDINDLEVLGPNDKYNFLQRIEELKNSNMFDYRLIGSIGFTNISEKRWSLILRYIRIPDLINLSDEELSTILHGIKGIGSSIINTIIDERKLLMQDLITIYKEIPYRESYSTNTPSIQIRFSGVRDLELMTYLQSIGYDCDDSNVTKKTNILIIPYHGYSSTKTKKVSSSCKILPIDEFKNYVYLNKRIEDLIM